MDWDKLFTMQKNLDEYIEKNNDLFEKELFNQKYLALLVELGELANETRCFKFWSTKARGSRDNILEEYVDGLHFILSLGIEKDLKFSAKNVHKTNLCETDQFSKVFEACINFKKDVNKSNYDTLFDNYIQLGQLLGFNEKDIQSAYFEKNEVNYERQIQGY